MVWVLHGNQLLMPLSFIPTQHHSGFLLSRSYNFLSAFSDAKPLGDRITERILSKDQQIKFNVGGHLTGLKGSLN